MHDHTSLLLYFPLLCGVMLVVDHTARLHAATDLAHAGAFRAARSLSAHIDHQGELEAGALDAARQQAALALLPVTPSGSLTAPVDGAVSAAADRLADELGIAMGGDLSMAAGRTTVQAWADERPLQAGDALRAGQIVTVVVEHDAYIRPDPVCWIFSEGAVDGAPSRTVRGAVRVVIGGGA